MWQGIVGHDQVAEQFRRTLRRGRLASTYLFVGTEGVGKRRFALELARALVCQAPGSDPLEPCGQCESCRLCDAGTHPDLEIVGLPPDKSTLPIGLFIGDDDRRNQEGLCHRIALKPFLGGRKIAIIDDADHFSAESANCLLKTLEEPPPRSVVILIGTSPSRQLPTIRSRSQVVRFGPLAIEDVADILLRTGAASDRDQAVAMAAHSGGSVARARELADPALWQFREQLLRELARPQGDALRLSRAIQAFVDEAGKDAAPRRERLRTVIDFAEEFYRGLLRARVGAPVTGDAVLSAAIQERLASGGARSPYEATHSLCHCLDTWDYVDRNANLGLAIQKWCTDLAAAG